jgi:hypothetical protein
VRAGLAAGLLLWLLVAAAGVRGAGAPSAALLEETPRPLLLTAQIGGQAHAVAVSGRNAYLSTASGLVVLDAADPARLRPLGQIRLPVGGPHSPAVLGDIVATAGGTVGVLLVDVSDPSRPQLAAQYIQPMPDRAAYASSVVARGNRLFVSYGEAGLVILDIADPRHPVLAGRFADLVPMYAAVAGDRLYVVDANSGRQGLEIIDISDGAPPTVIARDNHAASTVAVRGTLAYVGRGEQVDVVDMAAPDSPKLLGSYVPSTRSLVRHVLVDRSRVLVVDSVGGLHVVDMSDPAHPVEQGGFNPDGSAVNVAVSGDAAFLVEGNDGLHVLDLTSTGSLRRIGGYRTGAVWDVALDGAGKLVAVGNGLATFDLADPAHPRPLGWYDVPGITSSVALAGSIALATNVVSGLHIVDLADPTAPRPLAVRPMAASDVAVADRLAYVVSGDRLTFLDITDPRAPREVGALLDVGHVPQAVDITAGFALLAEQDGLAIVDAREPDHPRLVGRYAAGGPVEAIDAAGQTAYLAVRGTDKTTEKGIHVVDFRSPAQPTRVGYWPGTCTTGVHAESRRVAVSNCGAVLLDVLEPTLPHATDKGWIAAMSRGVSAAPGSVYLAGDGSGLMVFREATPYVYLPWSTP